MSRPAAFKKQAAWKLKITGIICCTAHRSFQFAAISIIHSIGFLVPLQWVATAARFLDCHSFSPRYGSHRISSIVQKPLVGYFVHWLLSLYNIFLPYQTFFNFDVVNQSSSAWHSAVLMQIKVRNSTIIDMSFVQIKVYVFALLTEFRIKTKFLNCNVFPAVNLGHCTILQQKSFSPAP